MNFQIITKTFEYSNKNSIIYPFLAFKKKLNNENFFFKISYSLDKLYYSDYILIDSKFHRNDWENNENKIYQDFDRLRKYTNNLIYFDTTDSTGMIQSEILDYVDEYWKFQILKNKYDYQKKYYGGRIFSDYYNSNFYVSDNSEIYSKYINDKNLNKIKAAWNFGLADYSYQNKYFFYLRKYFLKNYFFFFKKKKIKEKNLGLFAAFNYEYSRETISFQRKKIKSLLGNLFSEKINDYKYHQLLEQSKFVISPFGWGELAYRDFEAFYNKCLLIKPNMDHLLTWPNFYIKNETYLDFAWDLNDLEDKIEKINLNRSEYDEISFNGYNNYNKYTSDINSGNYFVDRIRNLLNE